MVTDKKKYGKLRLLSWVWDALQLIQQTCSIWLVIILSLDLKPISVIYLSSFILIQNFDGKVNTKNMKVINIIW